MAKEEDKVMVELELPRDQVSVRPTDVEPGSDNGQDKAAKSEEDKALKEIDKHKEDARQELTKTRQELHETKKEVEKLKEKVEEKSEESEKTKESGDGESMVKQATGYEASEIITAPFSPSDPEAKKKPKISQLRLILVGFVVVFLGVVLWPVFSFSVGLSIIIVGAVLVAVGVLFRV